ncbi:hypothetical protein [Actinomadura rudentiformis]|uniref:Uncharacterized protein n=1 Tax=Actinomadura rudentiformis TaxID=359158 RepID=A0A6H9YP01_9ACTN|nr:hypothetical protein [Actinomadura rudentiformis]KAB2342459.1 hypothetical protein F8566_38605 [Actinomadura rudentiformis]
MTFRRRMLLGLALTFFCLTGAPAAAADCVHLRGPARELLDRSALCRNLRQELTGRKPDLGRAIRKSVRGARRPALRQRPERAAKRPPIRHRPTKATRPPRQPTRTITAAPSLIPQTTAPAEDGLPQGTFPSIVAVVLLGLGFAFHQMLTRPVPALAPAAPVQPEPPATVLGTAERLAQPTGLGVIGPGANGFVRAVLVELVTRGAKVVITRNELNRLFEGDFEESLRQALAPRLHVCELLEEAIEHLELDQLMAEAEQANPDLSPTRGHGLPTYWISTPGQDDDVVLPLARRANLIGLMFGEWPHGTTCTIDSNGTITQVGARETELSLPALGPAEALTRLRAYSEWF